MKKLLLTTAAVLAAGVANAQSPTITVGGNADFQVGVTDQEQAYETGVFSRDYHTRNDTELFFNIDGETDGGLKYGAYIELEANVSGDDTAGGRNNNAERTFIYLEKDSYGRVELGAVGDSADRLRVDASRFNSKTLASATGGIDGDFNQYVALGFSLPQYVLPGLPTSAGLPGWATAGTRLNNKGDFSSPNQDALATANKINYFSPRVAGFQLGVSYTPDVGERGNGAGFGQDGFISDVISAGLNYEGEYELGDSPLLIAASVTGEMGDDKVGGRDDIRAYAGGLSASYLGFTFGGSYGILDEINGTAGHNSDGSYWTAGGAYELGAFSTSVTYLASELNNFGLIDSEFTNLSVGADYKLAPGLMPYVEVNFFDSEDDNMATPDNDGTVVIVGTQITF